MSESLLDTLALLTFSSIQSKTPTSIKEILLPYEETVFGEFTFSQLDLTCFKDMNTYLSILTTNLEDGTVTRHDRSKQYQTWLSN